MKENLLLSIISILWSKAVTDNVLDKEKIEKDFIYSWKQNIINITQEQLKSINDTLNENNIDMLNLISGEKQIADIEDYQQIINENLLEIEKIYWKICGKHDK